MDISPDDISSVIRLVREVCDRWDDPRVWREHLLRGVCRLVHGNVGTILGVDALVSGRLGRVRTIAAVGLPEPMRKALVDASVAQVSDRELAEASENMAPGLAKFFAEFERQGWATLARDQITDAATYHASPNYLNFHRLADCDDFVWSTRFVDLPRRIESICVDRPHGARPFGSREVMLLKFLHDEIVPLIGVRLATEVHLCRDGLSKRLRQTLSHLLDGKSEKQVAAALGIGGRTVHDYVTMLYRHFNVASRAELLAYFVRRTPARRMAEAQNPMTPNHLRLHQ